jgi:hypothetical protein
LSEHIDAVHDHDWFGTFARNRTNDDPSPHEQEKVRRSQLQCYKCI